MMARGLIIAAPASGSGKTVLTLALLRHFRNAGVAVASVKVGPDYIDPAFHAAASGAPCLNIDAWAMRAETLGAVAAHAGDGVELIIGEGVMGLFDGASGGGGSTADVAELTGWPVVLVIDAKGLGASAAALVRGFRDHRPETPLGGIVFNRVGSARHAQILTDACAPLGVPVLGALPRDAGLALPDRHLGLVQAGEHTDLEAVLEHAADLVARHVDTARLSALARPCRLGAHTLTPALPPLGQRIAVARDLAFAFAYPFVLDGWRAAGADVVPFSPLADAAPDPAADAIYLPGGYPELHAGRLSGNARFLDGLRGAGERGAVIYGECGGYMVLGRGLIDAHGARHAMAGLLPVETSFAAPKMTLGYREAALTGDGPLGAAGTRYRGHEFHFARVSGGEGDAPLFACRDAGGGPAGHAGARVGHVMGSFVHLIDTMAEAAPARLMAGASA